MARTPRRTRKPAATPAPDPDPVVAEKRQQAVEDTRDLDGLPADLRLAIRSCDFWIATPRMRRGLDLAELTRRIKAVKTQAEANEVNRIIVTQINRVGTGFGPSVKP